MIPAVKHFDPVLGVDVHIVLVPSPAGPVPTPVPHPFTGILFDPLDYVPPFAATVLVNGLPRAQAGSGVVALPAHVPMLGPFLTPPGNEGELFMGSSTVLVEDEPMGYGALPVLTCQDIGRPAPPRGKRPMAPRSPLLPTSIVLPIPSVPQVFVGGAPTVSLSALAMHALGPLAKQLKKGLKKVRAAPRVSRKMKGATRYLNQVADKVFARLGISNESRLRNRVSRAICTVTGHPVDVPTGKVFTDFVDLTLPGPLPSPMEVRRPDRKRRETTRPSPSRTPLASSSATCPSGPSYVDLLYQTLVLTMKYESWLDGSGISEASIGRWETEEDSEARTVLRVILRGEYGEGRKGRASARHLRMLISAAMAWEQPRTVGLVIDMSCLEYFGGDTLLSWDFLLDEEGMDDFRIAFLCSAENAPH